MIQLKGSLFTRCFFFFLGGGGGGGSHPRIVLERTLIGLIEPFKSLKRPEP